MALAKQTGAPVIVLDRVQVYREVTIASGRPLPSELHGTTRIYLTERRIADGELPASEAYDLLVQQIETLACKHRFLILEGGSVSLCTALFESHILQSFPASVQYLVVHDMAGYRQRLLARILDMLQGQVSIVDELAQVWCVPQQRMFVQTIGGYKAIVGWCSKQGISPLDLPRYTQDSAVRSDVAATILTSYLEYSDHQSYVFHQLMQIYEEDGEIL